MDTTEVIDRTIKECVENVVRKNTKSGDEFFDYPNFNVDILHSCPFLANDPKFTNIVHATLQESFPKLTIYLNIEKTFASEDFSRYLQILPGTFISLGTRNIKKKIIEVDHSSMFDIDEDILIVGTGYFIKYLWTF